NHCEEFRESWDARPPVLSVGERPRRSLTDWRRHRRLAAGKETRDGADASSIGRRSLTAALPPVAPPPRHTLDPIEIASRDEIGALQLKRLKAGLRHAYDNVGHFRAKCGALGIAPDDLKDLADLAKFPFTTKEDLRRTYPFGMFAVPRE